MGEKRECPHCGAPVYATDDVCMSCGEPLAAIQAPGPSKARRRASTVGLPVTERIVAYFGVAWDIFPWAAMACGSLVGLLRTPMLRSMPFLEWPCLVVTGLGGMALIAWIIIDVMHKDAYPIWPFVAIFCPPLGLVAYLVWGRR